MIGRDHVIHVPSFGSDNNCMNDLVVPYVSSVQRKTRSLLYHTRQFTSRMAPSKSFQLHPCRLLATVCTAARRILSRMTLLIFDSL